MREDEVGLQLGQAIGRDGGVGEQAEAGVDAVDGFARGDDALDRGGRGANAAETRGVELGGRALPQLAKGGGSIVRIVGTSWARLEFGNFVTVSEDVEIRLRTNGVLVGRGSGSLR